MSRGGIVGTLACLFRGSRIAEEFAIEVDVLLEVGHRHLSAVAGDDGIGAFVQSVVTLFETVCNQSSASAVVRIQERNVLSREDIGRMHNPQRRK